MGATGIDEPVTAASGYRLKIEIKHKIYVDKLRPEYLCSNGLEAGKHQRCGFGMTLAIGCGVYCTQRQRPEFIRPKGTCENSFTSERLVGAPSCCSVWCGRLSAVIASAFPSGLKSGWSSFHNAETLGYSQAFPRDENNTLMALNRRRHPDLDLETRRAVGRLGHQSLFIAIVALTLLRGNQASSTCIGRVRNARRAPWCFWREQWKGSKTIITGPDQQRENHGQ